MIQGSLALALSLSLGDIVIDPPPAPEDIQPASIDLHLGRSFVVFSGLGRVLDFRDPDVRPEVEVSRFEADHISLHPGQFALATTAETVAFSTRFVGRIEGKSSVGRIGLLTHVTAGFVDPGWSGQLTLELCNVSTHTLVLPAGLAIAQIAFFEAHMVGTPYGEANGNHYGAQQGATVSRLVKPYTRRGHMRVYEDGGIKVTSGED
jgi:dCTP deaminase